MPIYVFVCKSCENTFNKFVRKMDVQTVTCTQCGLEAERGVEVPSPFQWGRGGSFHH